jgi:ATP-binding protein involved in chromosome partitioning
MAGPTEAEIRAAAEAVAQIGRVGGVAAKDGAVQVSLEVDPGRAGDAGNERRAVEAALARLPGVTSATVVLTAERAAPAPPPERQPAGGAAGQTSGRIELPGVKSIVAVASGKGGVGKSTVAVNLAVALARQGLAVGLMDSDVYGPSLPRMMGISGKPALAGGKTLLPMRRWGVACMSIGFLISEETAMIWRGPMVMSAVQQLVGDVAWGALDILLIDMPPGTGDAQLTLSQRVPLTGAVVVSTPQDIALLDARRGIAMFDKVEVPVLGMVENMSTFVCPHCGEATDVFKRGGVERTAELLDCEVLGAIPLDGALVRGSDDGLPIVVSDAGGSHAAIFRGIVAAVERRLLEVASERPTLTIV